MSKNPGNKSAPPAKGGSPLLTGILVGMVVGVGLAAGLAWFILKSPSPFVNKEQAVAAKPASQVPKLAAAPVEAAKPAAQAASASAPAAAPAANAANAGAPASAVGEAKPRFEFYKVLTDKQDTTTAVPAKPVEKTQSAESKAAAAAKEIYYLQAGSFPSSEDAEKLRAKLTLMGMEVSLQTVTIPDKGVWHRVRVGPYKGADEMNKAKAALKQNGLDATPIRGL
ncbi:MAG TPA: SPOR domain-containing protein [Gallionella sp.]|nr:SPOR domain-containing protein [Gallionella sp.]